MEFPSIKLNILKKLEYFLEFRELNKKFDSQFKVLINKKWDSVKGRFMGAYPSWEIEKKILFWTYAFHKHLGRPIKEGHFKDMFISHNEYKKIGVERIFENLESNGFGIKKVERNKDTKEVQFFINSKGLTYGELLWYMYKPKKYIFQNELPPRKYTDVFQTSHQLTRCSIGVFIFYLQLTSLYLFTILAGLFFTLELLDKISLLDNIKNIVINNFYYPDIFIILLILPMLFFVFSIILDIGYRICVVKNKYKNIEKIRTA